MNDFGFNCLVFTEWENYEDILSNDNDRYYANARNTLNYFTGSISLYIVVREL